MRAIIQNRATESPLTDSNSNPRIVRVRQGRLVLRANGGSRYSILFVPVVVVAVLAAIVALLLLAAAAPVGNGAKRLVRREVPHCPRARIPTFWTMHQ